jgi:hypothetical protein
MNTANDNSFNIKIDKEFVINLNNFIEEELLIILKHSDQNYISKEKFLIFKQALNKVINILLNIDFIY